MLNPEKILGGLLKGNSRGGMLGKLGAGGVGLGLLGVAMEAAEHYMNKPRTTQSAGPPPGPPAAVPSPGPVKPPPPPPGGSSGGPPPPPDVAGPGAADAAGDAVLLIRSMIAAANADGMIDEAERDRILDKLKAVHLTSEENSFIMHELLSPCDLGTIVKAVKSPETARQVYAVSLMAIEVDTDAERRYLQTLGSRLGLDGETVKQIHLDLGVDHNSMTPPSIESQKED